MTQLEDRLDEMREQLELWVLRAGAETVDPSGLAACCTSARPRKRSVTRPNSSCGSSSAEEEMRPILAVALGEADEVFVQYPIGRGSALDGAVAAGTQIGDDTGFHLLAIRREGRYFYRPRRITLAAGDEILATGPWEGRAVLARQCGFRLVEDDDTGAVELVPSGEAAR